MKNLNKNRSLSLIIMLIFHTIFTSVPAVDWQGYGNMSASNLTEIWAYINNNIGNVTSSDYKAFTVGFSDKLNQLWDPAWNIFTLNTAAGKDSVLYGYAFRDHWMWYNGFIAKTDYLTFVIWKDYNCQTWVTYIPTSFMVNGLIASEQNQMNTVRRNFSANSVDDIWAAGKKFIDELELQSNFTGKGYSILITQQGTKSPFTGRFCTFGSKYVYSLITFANSQRGQFFIFQTRQD